MKEAKNNFASILHVEYIEVSVSHTRAGGKISEGGCLKGDVWPVGNLIISASWSPTKSLKHL